MSLYDTVKAGERKYIQSIENEKPFEKVSLQQDMPWMILSIGSVFLESQKIDLHINVRQGPLTTLKAKF